MQVRISTISPHGLKVKDKLPLEELNQRMQEGANNDIVFTLPPEVDLTVYRTGGGAETKGRATTRFRQPCSRCMDNIERNLTVDTNYLLAPRPEGDSSYEDDVGITYYKGDHVDLEPLIQESFILALNPFWHPPIEPDGSCSYCHKTLPSEHPLVIEETPPTLGALLSKAGIKKS